jgi:hypothetical protein
VLYGDVLIARIEFYARGGNLEVRRWHEEATHPNFYPALEVALRDFMAYCGASEITIADEVASKPLAKAAKAAAKGLR